MAMPELPDGLWWRVQRESSTEFERVGVYLDCETGPDPDRILVDMYDLHNEAAIVKAVENAAHRRFCRYQNDAYLDNLIARNWPCPT